MSGRALSHQTSVDHALTSGVIRLSTAVRLPQARFSLFSPLSLPWSAGRHGTDTGNSAKEAHCAGHAQAGSGRQRRGPRGSVPRARQAHSSSNATSAVRAVNSTSSPETVTPPRQGVEVENPSHRCPRITARGRHASQTHPHPHARRNLAAADEYFPAVRIDALGIIIEPSIQYFHCPNIQVDS